jgi:hypothetical protein
MRDQPVAMLVRMQENTRTQVMQTCLHAARGVQDHDSSVCGANPIADIGQTACLL